MLVDLTVEVGPLLRETLGYAMAVVLGATALYTLGKLFSR